MIDLACLVADKNLHVTMSEILGRFASLEIRPIQCQVIVHPNRDPGCFHRPEELLGGYREQAAHALIVLDRAWEGSPAGCGADLESQIEGRLATFGWSGWGRAIVIEPELEAWVFSDSPNVSRHLGWPGDAADLRVAVGKAGLWPSQSAKPPDPK